MPYMLRYQAQLVFVGSGAGPMGAASAPALPGTGGGTGQAKEFSVNTAIQPIVAGAGAGGTLSAGDVTALTNAMAADMATQINAALATVNQWPSGGP